MTQSTILTRSKHEKRHITLHTHTLKSAIADKPRGLSYELLENAHTLRRRFREIDHMLHDIY
jgi:hypothetical protein